MTPTLAFKGAGMRILDFDTEVRPLSYLGSDFTTGEVTGLAAAWIVNGKPRGVKCWLLGRDDPAEMLEGFRELYDAADMVTGHFIRGYDLPVLNGAYLDNGLRPLGDKLTHDTKNDLVRRKYVSASQENLAASLGVRAPKIQMNQQLWRDANRLTESGLALTEKRVVGDVRQHVALREALLAAGWLGAPKVWRSAGSGAGSYVP